MNANRVNGKLKPKKAAVDMSISCERSLIGCVVMAGLSPIDAFAAPAVQRVRPHHFVDPLNAAVWQVVLTVRAEGKTVDPSVLVDRLKATPHNGETLYHVADSAWLCKLQMETGNVANAQIYADEIIDSYATREAKLTYDDAASRMAAGEDFRSVHAATVDRLAALQKPKAASRPPTLRQLREQHPTLRPPVIHGLLRVGETMNVVSPTKVGKSWLAASLAILASGGGKWLGFQTEPGNVLYIDNELHAETLADRLPHVGEALHLSYDSHGDEATYADKITCKVLRGELTDIFQLDSLFAQFEPGEFKYVIIDAAYRALPVGTNENDNAAMAAVYNRIDHYASRLNAAFVTVVHTSKGDQSGKKVTDVGSGAGSQSRAVDCHLVLRQHEEDNAFVLDAAVRSFAPVQPKCLRWNWPLWTEDDSLNPSHLAGPKSQAGGPSKEQQLLQLLAAGAMTKNALRKALKLNGTDIKLLTDLLLENGQIVKETVETDGGPFEGFALAQ